MLVLQQPAIRMVWSYMNCTFLPLNIRLCCASNCIKKKVFSSVFLGKQQQKIKKNKKNKTHKKNQNPKRLSLITLFFLDLKVIPPISVGVIGTMKNKLRRDALSLKFSLLCQKAINGLAENKQFKLGSKSLSDKAISWFNKNTMFLWLEHLWSSLI